MAISSIIDSRSEESEEQNNEHTGRCALKRDLPRLQLNQRKSDQLWLSLVFDDPWHVSPRLQRDLKEPHWRVRRWHGRPPHTVAMNTVYCVSLPCKVAQDDGTIKIFELTQLDAYSINHTSAVARVTSWIPNQQHILEKSSDLATRLKHDPLNQTLIIERIK